MIPLGHATFQVVGNKVGSKLRGFPRNLRPLLWGQGICPRGAALGPASPRALGKPGFSRFCGLPRRYIDNRLGELVGPLALQLLFPRVSESIGNHDSKIVDAGSVD
jgi:hypothetical protein